MGILPGHRTRSLRALSLFEMLVTLALLGLTVGLMGLLGSQYLRLCNRPLERGQVSLLTHALEGMRLDFQGAILLHSPQPDPDPDQNLVLSFEKLASSTRFPQPLPSPFLPILSPSKVRVSYTYDGPNRSLRRRLDQGPAAAIGREVAGFFVRRVGLRQVEVTLSCPQAESLQKLRLQLYCWSKL